MSTYIGMTETLKKHFICMYHHGTVICLKVCVTVVFVCVIYSV